MICPAGLVAGPGLVEPYPASICYLRSSFALADGHSLFRLGTGAIMDTAAGGTHVLTAAHTLFIGETGLKAGSVELWFGCDGPTARAHVVSDDFHVPAAFQTSTYDAATDFAVIRVPPLDPSQFPPIGLFQSAAAQPVRLAGYPVEGACAGQRRAYHVDTVATPSGPTSYAYDAPTYEGMSGGPLLLSQPAGPVSCGVLIQGDGQTRAVRVSDPVVAQLIAWLG